MNNVLPANQSGTVLTNRVQADFGIVFGDGSTATFTDSKSAQTTLTEPKLVIDKTIAPDAGIQAGSPVTVTLQASNSGTGPAYDVNVSDLLNDTNNDGVVDGGDITVYDCSSINLGASGVNYPADFAAAVTGAAPACRVSLHPHRGRFHRGRGQPHLQFHGEYRRRRPDRFGLHG